MSQETYMVLERLVVLLGAKPPHIATARKQLKDLLEKKPCAAETDVARKTAARLFAYLAAPLLLGDPEMRVLAEGLRERILRSGSLSGARTQLDKASSWITRRTSGQDASTNERMPALLSERLLTALRVCGESYPVIVDETRHLLDLEKGVNPWLGIERLLHLIDTLDETPPPKPWEVERQTLQEALQTVMTRIGVRHEGDGSESGSLEAMILALRHHGKGLRQRARSLAAQIDANKEMAERLRERLRQLEEALCQARLDGFMDPVTGLPDRFAFTAQLKRHLERAVHLHEPFSLALLHVHDFETTMERFGREGERRLVAGLIKEIQNHLREEEYLARLSESRFVILFPKSDQQRALITTKEIEIMVSRTQFVLDDKVMLLECHLGTVELGPGMTGQEMLELTDRVAAASRSERKQREPLLLPLRRCIC